LLFVLTKPSLLLARWLLYGYVVSRVAAPALCCIFYGTNS
jgi:hypothetical protein